MTEIYKDYIQAQKNQDVIDASQWSLFNRNPGIGAFDQLNAYCDFHLLLNKVPNSNDKKFLDFGCGPGRTIRNMQHVVQSIDGVDLSKTFTEHACKYLHFCGYNPRDFNFYTTNGFDLSEISDLNYDVIVSTLTLQRICIYDIRFNYFKEFFRVLKEGGMLSMQMSYGVPAPNTVNYKNNEWKVGDPLYNVAIEDPSDLETDLISIGFIDFKYEIVQPGPGESAPSWIIFNATKPITTQVEEPAPEVVPVPVEEPTPEIVPVPEPTPEVVPVPEPTPEVVEEPAPVEEQIPVQNITIN